MNERGRREIFARFDRWGFDVRGWAPATRRRYYLRAEAADRWLAANRGVSLIWATPRDLRSYLFSTKPSARNRNQIRQALMAFGAFCIDTELTVENPATSLPRLPEPASLPKALSMPAAHRLVVVAPLFGEEPTLLIYLLLYQGLRKSEARFLEWTAYDPDGYLRFTGKRSKDRVLPLHPRTQAALDAWRRLCRDARWVFPSPTGSGRPVSHTWIRNLVREIGQQAGIEGLHPHALRHTFATRLVEKKVHLSKIQKAMGHASPVTTSIYLRIQPTDITEDIRSLDFDAPS